MDYSSLCNFPQIQIPEEKFPLDYFRLPFVKRRAGALEGLPSRRLQWRCVRGGLLFSKRRHVCWTVSNINAHSIHFIISSSLFYSVQG